MLCNVVWNLIYHGPSASSGKYMCEGHRQESGTALAVSWENLNNLYNIPRRQSQVESRFDIFPTVLPP